MPNPSDRPDTGVMQNLAPGLRRIIAPNPSPMTYWGTNSFVLGEGQVAVIDPGPADPHHMHAILDGLAPGETITHILVTHAHLDHSPLARPLAQATGAPVIAYGRATAGRSAVMEALVAQGLSSGGEGVDPDFDPDICLADGEIFQAGGMDIEAIWTPGHFSNHLCFATQGTVFTGDHVMAWASSLVSPPDGDLTAFMASCHKLAARNDRVYYPAHGPEITDPAKRINWLIEHRQTREAQILDALKDAGAHKIADVTRQIYTETPPPLIPAAQRNVFAHLIDLTQRNITTATPEISVHAKFSMIE